MPEAKVLLICDDLFFTSKVTGTAQGVGLPIAVCNSVSGAIGRITEETSLVMLDLSNPASATAEEMTRLRQALPESARLLAYGSHVNVERLHAARAAGCDPVLARSEFTKNLSALLQSETSAGAESARRAP